MSATTRTESRPTQEGAGALTARRQDDLDRIAQARILIGALFQFGAPITELDLRVSEVLTALDRCGELVRQGI